MATTPSIKTAQARALGVIRQTTPAIKAPQARVMVPYNVPAKAIKATAVQSMVPYREVAQQIRATQMAMMVVVKGKVDNPKLKSWTYTMDAHDLFVLKLGTYFKTLVYDLTTQNWSWWTSNPPDGLTESNWRTSCGLNWITSGSIAYNEGSNVVVGDDSSNILWVLDPEYGLDDSLDPVGDPTTFERTATGQMTTEGRNFIPVYEVDLSFANGDPALVTDKVTLSYSDDMGSTYQVADGPSVVISGNYYQQFQWRSLGQVRAPGRLFRITDNGAFPRIDSMDINPEVGK